MTHRTIAVLVLIFLNVVFFSEESIRAFMLFLFQMATSTELVVLLANSVPYSLGGLFINLDVLNPIVFDMQMQPHSSGKR
jgi:hypothetical protein